MSDERWLRLRDLFEQVGELAEAERSAFLDRELADDAGLRSELERVLAAAESASVFLAPHAPASPHGSIGPYRLVEILGEGGFGVVWLAEQTEPIQRRVAIKLIRPGMDSRQVLARFEAERQALALMDHPAIAQVFEAGATESGVPYFVMEHVPGVPITAFCDRERLRVRDRLELFAAVCDAVQHAHQRGVIHRDLKPSNLIVTHRDGVAVPKVIDFGVVKATTPAAGDTLLTREGTVVGTVGYMSPEQAGATARTVDTRSDIYSLGVVLYELLTGALPFDPERLRRSPLSEALRVVREDDPPALARQLSSSEETLAAAAERRSTLPRRLLRDVSGELQWITLRAMEKDPERRYPSAAELAADIRRHLANEPVLAGAPSTVYRLRKLARRHRVAVAAAAIVLVAIVAGGVAAGFGLRRAVRAERAARREAESAEQVADFLVELFEASSPDRAQGRAVSAQTVLELGTRRIQAGLNVDPQVRVRLLTTLGNAHLGLGLYDDGIGLLREALSERESMGLTDTGATVDQLCALALGLMNAGRPDSVPMLLDRAIAIAGRTDGRTSPRYARCLWEKATWLIGRGDLPAADSLIARALTIMESEPQPELPLLTSIVSTKATVAHRRFDLEEAERCYLRVLDLAEATGAPTRAASAHRGLAWVYTGLGNTEEAASHAAEGVRIARKLYPPDHPKIAEALAGQGAALAGSGDFAHAIAAREEAVGILRAKDIHDQLAHELNSVGLLYLADRQPGLAVERLLEACALRRRLYGPENARLAESLANLGRSYAQAGNNAQAESSFREAIPVLDRLSPGSAFTGWAYVGYGNLCRAAGRIADADTLYVRAEAVLDSTNAGLRPWVGECLMNHGYLRSLQGRHAEAEIMMSRGFALVFGDHPQPGREAGEGYLMWAAVRAGASDPDGAIRKLVDATSCGVTANDADEFPALATLRSRPDYPLESSP